MKSIETIDNLVIGGGPAGSMVAMRLAGAGLEVTLIEKEAGPHHKVCGEFLSREAVGYLQQAGLSLSELGAAPIRSVRLSSGRRAVEAVLPFRAFSLSRYVLDAVMLERAELHGCSIRRGTSVEKVEPYGNQWQVLLRNGRSLHARTVFLANGKHDLRGWDRDPGKQSDFVGFKMHWQLNSTQTKSLRGIMELFLFPGGYGGLSLVETDVANLCLVVQRARLRGVSGWDGLVASILSENPHLLQRLQGAETLWDRPLAISPIPYGYLTERPNGVWCVGDQAAVIPSFTGDGMAIALHSGALAAEMHLAGKSAAQFHPKLREHLGHGMSLANMLSRAMVTDTCRRFAPLGLSVFPGAIRWIASSTRIPERVLVKEDANLPLEPTQRKQHLA
jgi:flavin-dependent dehydrogenase